MSKESLFVDEDMDVDVDMSETSDAEDDPVVKEIPLNLLSKELDLHLLQYVNKPRLLGRKPVEHPFVLASRYKKKSALWELDIPLDEHAFFNKNKTENEWEAANLQTLRGVGVPNEGQYAAICVDGELYLSKISDVAQMRPTFKYLDSIAQKKKQEENKNNMTAASQRSQVVTMSVKSVSDQSQNRLTGSLLAHKIADEDDYEEYEWTIDQFEQFKNAVIEESQKNILEPQQSTESYISSLV
ncbi:Sin-like protein conserved region [Nakaseomyces glabratus]